ncbi:porin [Piscinibacter sp. XHJ-5]|uniref:porin n=1 Tax=Piscinibacter sp. XHJ-5 TaxID=3037797 RepID=UPI002453160F|nr:porin [Piscinibacter sp. XHJ-5]
MIRPLTLRAAMGAAALAAAGAAPAQNVQLYGLIDMTAGRFQQAGTDAVWRADSGGMTTSFLGFRGTDDLGGGLKAKFAFEHFLRADTGQAGRFGGDAFWARDAYVGLSGAFGTTVLGRNTTPLFVSTVLFNAFGDSYAFSPAVRQLFTPAMQAGSPMVPFLGDSGWNNSIHYASGDDDDDGFSWNLIANLGEGAPGGTGKNTGANLMYANGPLAATVAWQRVRNGDGISSGPPLAPAGFTKQDTWLVAGSYDLQVVKLFTHAAMVRMRASERRTTQLWGVGASVPFGPGKVLAQYGNARVRLDGVHPTNHTLSIGYDYSLSKRTDVYAVFVNDRTTGLEKGNTLAGGVRVRF